MFSGTPTPNLNLPQWEPGDHPEWLNDMNGAFKTIDSNVGELIGTANGASKLIKELIPIVERHTEEISALDTREESDRAFLQQQVNELKNVDVTLKGLIDKLESSTAELTTFTDELDKRLKEEESTTAGFSSAAGNTIMDRFNALQKDLTTTTTNLRNLQDDFNTHVSDFNRKYSDLNTRLIDAEGDIDVLENRVQALEDWKSPFSQQVDELEKKYGLVTTEVVDIHKRLDALTTQVTNIENDIDVLTNKNAQQDTRISNVEADSATLHAELHTNSNRIDALVLDQTRQDELITELDAKQVVQENDITDLTERVTALEGGTVIDMSKLEVVNINFKEGNKILIKSSYVDSSYNVTDGESIWIDRPSGTYEYILTAMQDYINSYDLDAIPDNSAVRLMFVSCDSTYALLDKDTDRILYCPMVVGSGSCVIAKNLEIASNQIWGNVTRIYLDETSSALLKNKLIFQNGIRTVYYKHARLSSLPEGWTTQVAYTQNSLINAQIRQYDDTVNISLDNGVITAENVPARQIILSGCTRYMVNLA